MSGVVLGSKSKGLVCIHVIEVEYKGQGTSQCARILGGVDDGGCGQDGRQLWRRQSGTGGRPVESARPRSASCPRLPPIASVRRLGVNAKLRLDISNTDPERPAPGASLGELIYLENNGSAISSISDDLRRDPSTSDGSQ